jgi:hypothetical protein
MIQQRQECSILIAESKGKVPGWFSLPLWLGMDLVLQ